MARDLDIRYETAVNRIVCDGKGRVCGVETSAGEIDGSAVISAIPSPELLPLYSDWTREQEGFLREFTYTKMPLVILEGRVRDEVTYFGGVLDRLAETPIQTWNYRAEDPSIRHMGPVAQDFHAAFGVGEGDRHISTVDADGVALAAIQGLHSLVREKDAQVASQQQQINSLESRVETLEQIISSLVDRGLHTND